MRTTTCCAALLFILAFNRDVFANVDEQSAPMRGQLSDDCLANKALSGDAEAAKACASHYLKGDQKLFRYWTQIAAENGDVVSQYNFAVILLSTRNSHDKERAVFWLQKASARGNSLARDVLRDIRLNPNSPIPLPPPPPR